MNIINVKVGYLSTNCYILEKDKECLVVDPGYDIEKIKSSIKSKLVGILITHHHHDHDGALKDLLDYKSVPVYDYSNLKEGNVSIGNFNFEVIYTPGHTKDSITYYFYEDKSMFTGDFLFNNDIGRTDLPTGSDIEMKSSINKIKKYPDGIDVYPGHEEFTTLRNEKENNIYFN